MDNEKGRTTCPKCGALAVLFADYEVNNESGLGLRCARRCGWKETMADLRTRYKEMRIAQEKAVVEADQWREAAKWWRKAAEWKKDAIGLLKKALCPSA